MVRSSTIWTVTGLCMLAACGGESEPAEQSAAPESAPEPPVVGVTAMYEGQTDRHLFRTNVDTVAAGWTTFRFTNASPVMHFVFLDHLPEGRTSEDLLRDVSPVFQESADLAREGRAEEAAALFETLPEWFSDLVFRGGTGLTSPGLTSEVTLYLEPGDYVLECYVKTEDGAFHWSRGMHQDLHVTAEPNGFEEPSDPTLTVTLTDSDMAIEGEATPGDHLVAVRFQQENPGLIGRDVHVARLGPDADVDEIVAWVDFNLPEGLVSTANAPAPAEFLGGAHEMPFGNTAYFEVTLEPGEYLFISEQATADAVHRRITVPPAG